MPRQYAQALVASFPYLPDALALAGCIAAAEAPCSASNGATSSQQQALGAGSPDPGTWLRPGLASPPNSGSARHADALPMTAWPGPPPAAEGADPNPSSAPSPADESADRACTLKPSAASGEVPAVSESINSAFRAAAQAPLHKA